MMKAINMEISLLAASGSFTVDTIYFGGGTPSILSNEDVAEVLNSISKNYVINQDAEITIEANPDDISDEKLKNWKLEGINRLSIGIQSFFEEDLKWMSRAHNADQAKRSLDKALELFDNITIDLIYGTPGLTNEKWIKNLNTAFELGVPHLSCYALTIEPQTPLSKLIKLHKKEDINQEHQSEQFQLLTKQTHEAGYEHYEISNFAKPGFRSRHNSSYWQGKPYIGIGPSAHSYNGYKRSWNVANNQKYIDAISTGKLPTEEEVLTPIQRFNETIMISLRTIDGIQLHQFSEQEKNKILFGAEIYVHRGWLQITDGRIVLTKEGKFYADGIASDLFFEE